MGCSGRIGAGEFDSHTLFRLIEEEISQAVTVTALDMGREEVLFKCRQGAIISLFKNSNRSLCERHQELSLLCVAFKLLAMTALPNLYGLLPN